MQRCHEQRAVDTKGSYASPTGDRDPAQSKRGDGIGDSASGAGPSSSSFANANNVVITWMKYVVTMSKPTPPQLRHERLGHDGVDGWEQRARDASEKMQSLAGVFERVDKDLGHHEDEQ